LPWAEGNLSGDVFSAENENGKRGQASTLVVFLENGPLALALSPQAASTAHPISWRDVPSASAEASSFAKAACGEASRRDGRDEPWQSPAGDSSARRGSPAGKSPGRQLSMLFWRRPNAARRVVPGAKAARNLHFEARVVNDRGDAHRVLADGAAEVWGLGDAGLRISEGAEEAGRGWERLKAKG